MAATALLGSLTLAVPAPAAAFDRPAAVSTTDAATADGPRPRVAAPKISRDEEIRRAEVWLKEKVPYSQEKTWKDGYRQDCSGFVSMTLGLPKPGPNTVALKNDGWTKPIKMSELRRGDLVIKANSSSSNERHVVIFDGWKDGRNSYLAYEQAGHVGTRHTEHTYGLEKGDGYAAYRPVNLSD
nr:NlpC/P60 family protein [Kitasatospora sp. SID7827]